MEVRRIENDLSIPVNCASEPWKTQAVSCDSKRLARLHACVYHINPDYTMHGFTNFSANPMPEIIISDDATGDPKVACASTFLCVLVIYIFFH